MTKLHHIIKESSPKQWTTWILGCYFLFFIHYFQINNGGSGLDHPMNPLGWIALSMVIACGLVQVGYSGEFRYNYLSRNLTIASLILLIPLLFAGDTGWYSHQRLLGLFAGLAFLIAIQQMNYKRRDYFNLFNFIVIAIFIESIISLIQFYVLPNFPELTVKFDRPTAFFFQANVAATFFAIGLSLSLILLQRHRKQRPNMVYLYYACTLTCTITLCLLQSRTGFIAAIFGSILLLCYRSTVNKRWAAFVLLGIGIAVSSIYSLDRVSRDSDIYTSPGLRSQIYQDSFELIAEHPLSGHGYGGFAKAYNEHQSTKIGQQDGYFPTYQMRHPHNEILLWVIEGGIVTLIAMLLIIATACKIIWCGRRQRMLAFVLLFPFALHSLTEFPFYQSIAAWMTFLILLSSCLHATKIKTLSTSKTVVYPVFSVLLVTMTSIYMVSILSSQYRANAATNNHNGAILLNSQLPFVSSAFEEELNKEKLIIAMRHGLNNEIKYYQLWATAKNNVDPRPNRYKNLLLCTLYFKQFERSEAIFVRATKLFPTLDWQVQRQWIDQRKNKIKHTN